MSSARALSVSASFEPRLSIVPLASSMRFSSALTTSLPPFAQSLSNQEVAAVVTYIRMSWGNHGTAVSPQQVSDLRSAPLD